jgi:hypothetical protein
LQPTLAPLLSSASEFQKLHAGAELNWEKAMVKPMIEAQELARRFNEDEAVWRSYEHKRELRRLLGSCSPLPEDILDYLDWQAAERECRALRAVGFFHP